ncbi:hypothetical protein [Acetobacter orientalis]|uniref:hypothetical protein n=1 Tax=Acetobacter orientalis TaxID=146474 RepID=UPI0039EC8426
MSDAKTSQYTLEEGVGRLQDGVEGLFTKASITGDDFGAPQGCAALEAVRDNVIDRPLFYVSLAGILGVVLGAVFKRKL